MKTPLRDLEKSCRDDKPGTRLKVMDFCGNWLAWLQWGSGRAGCE